MTWIQVGERIAKIRKSRYLSKIQFGKLIGVTGQYIGKIEKGSGLSTDLIIKICHETGVSADYILFGITEQVNDSIINNALQGLSNEQIQIALDIIKKVAQFINTENGNEVLIREVANQQCIEIISNK